jgi:hypothetical protein
VREDDTGKRIISYIEDASKVGGWLILYFHQIEPADVLNDKKWIYGTTSAILDEILNYLKKNRIEVLTVEKGMERLNIPGLL